jgi:hypothetical protein
MVERHLCAHDIVKKRIGYWLAALMGVPGAPTALAAVYTQQRTVCFSNPRLLDWQCGGSRQSAAVVTSSGRSHTGGMGTTVLARVFNWLEWLS